MGKANFTDDFKRDAVLQITERGYPVAEVAARLGISKYSLYDWKKRYAKPATARDDEQAAEVRRTGGRERQLGPPDDRRDASQGASHRRQPAQKGALPRSIGRSRGGLTSKLHVVCDGSGRPLRLALSEGQASDFKGAAMLVEALPPAKTMLADRGYDADWFRSALVARGIAPCIPSKINRKVAIPHDRALYRQRHRIENMFARLKDWRRIHTRYDRCAHTFLSAIAFAASFIFWLKQ